MLIIIGHHTSRAQLPSAWLPAAWGLKAMVSEDVRAGALSLLVALPGVESSADAVCFLL